MSFDPINRYRNPPGAPGLVAGVAPGMSDAPETALTSVDHLAGPSGVPARKGWDLMDKPDLTAEKAAKATLEGREKRTKAQEAQKVKAHQEALWAAIRVIEAAIEQGDYSASIVRHMPTSVTQELESLGYKVARSSGQRTDISWCPPNE